MKYSYTSQTKRSLFTKAFIGFLFLFPSFLHAEIYNVQLTNYSACGGATLVPFCFYTGTTTTPVTIYYERLGAANTWQIEGTQVYNYRSSYIQYNGSDLTSATTFRVRALDEITGNIYISNSVSVDPDKWNVDRGTAFSTAYATWGGSCGNSNFINIETNALTNGRPPFTLQYKKTTETTYTGAGETTGYGQIPNIEWGSSYDIRITDRCGKVVNLNTRLYLACNTSDLKMPSACNSNDGSVTLSPSTDDRYKGIPGYTYNVRKPGNSTTDTAFVTGNVFTNLSSGTYDYSIRDACGHTSIAGSIVMGSATPTGYANSDFDPLDSCFVNIDITATAGSAPLQYGISRFDTSHFTYSSSHIFRVTDPGVYYYRIIDACGNRNRDQYTYVVASSSTIDSVRTINNGCFKDIVVYAAYGLKPYQYVMTSLNPPYSVIKQSSDTFRNVAPNIFIFSIENRCGRAVAQSNWVYDTIACSLRTDTGSFESKNSIIGCANLSGNEWTDITDDKGNLIYSINPNGNMMNNVCWGVHVENNNGQSLRRDTIGGVPSYFLDRNFYIEPPANLVLTDSVSVRVYFTDAELQSMLGYLYDTLFLGYSASDLKIRKKHGSAGSPVDLEVTNDTTNQSQFTIITPTLMPYGTNWYMEFKVKDFSEFNPYMGELSVLPLQLLSFTAKTVNNAVQVNWTTANEVNTKSFAVQWRASGSSFATIGIVKANGGTANSYSFVHNTPNDGNNYYRLQEVDKDGTIVYSKTIVLNLHPTASLVLAPNPVHDQLMVLFPAGSHFTSVSVYDIIGKKVMQKSVSSSATQTEMTVQSLSAGIYRLVLEGEKQQSISFIKR